MAVRVAVISLAILTSFVHGTDINFNCPTGWMKDVYRCYKYFEQALEFPDAEQYCQAFGANLASPGDYGEQTFIGTSVVTGTADTKYWIGLTREQSSPTVSNTNQDAKWTVDPSAIVKMNEIGFWGPSQPKYSPNDIYTYVERVLTTWYPYKFRMYLVPKWSAVAGFVCQRRACLDNQLICNNGKCALGTMCDGKDDCGDFSDESSCTNQRTDAGVTYKSEVQTTPSSITVSSSLYLNNLRQQWSLQTDITSVIKITINNMNLEHNVDWLRIWAGAVTLEQSALVETLTGVAGTGKSYSSYNNLMLVTFDTDATTMASGFTATWIKETATPVYNAIVATFCPTEVSLAAGTISTRTRRTWSITTGDSFSIVTLKISKLKVPQNAGQFVYILNGADSSGMELIPSWADYAKTDYVMSLTNAMTVHLATESDLSEAEFVFSYWAGCDITLEQDSGVVVSPGQPTNQMYPNNLNCKFTLKATSATTMLQLKNDGALTLGVTSDTVKIWKDATATSGTPDYTATSALAPDIDPAMIKGTNMLVQFTSDQATSGSGFKIVFGKGCTLAASAPEAEVTKDIGQTYMKTCTNTILGQSQFTGSSVTLYCQYDGWRLTDANGAIVTQSPTCINTPCGATQTVANGYPVSQVNNMVTWACYVGYTLTNSPQACTNGVWGTMPVCTASTCVAPTAAGQLSVAHDPDAEAAYNVGSLAKYECADGYEMTIAPPWVRCDDVSGNNLFRYLSTQTLDSPAPVCAAKKCPRPVVANGVFTPDMSFYDMPAVVMVSCASGYMAAGTPVTMTCSNDGTWTGTPPTCADVVECPALTNPCKDPNTCTNTVGSYTCTCVAGFLLETTGTSGPTCNNIDECTDDPKACKPNAASGPGNPCTDLTPITVGGPPFMCTCESGYMFNIATYLCEKKQCQLPAATTNLVILANTARTYLEEDVIHVHCKIGWTPLTVTPVTCTDGAWAGLPTCAVATCTILSPTATAGIEPTLAPTSGTVNYGESLSITCTAISDTPVMKKCVYSVTDQKYELNLGNYLEGDKVVCPVAQCTSPITRLPASVMTSGTVPLPAYSGSAQVMVTCAGSTIMSGTTGAGTAPNSNMVTLDCLNGLWNVHTIVCSGGDLCEDPGFPAGGMVMATALPLSTATFSCITAGHGFKPSNDVSYPRLCRSDGTYTDLTPDPGNCVDITKPVLECGATSVTIPKYTALTPFPTANEPLRAVTVMPVGVSSSSIFYVDATADMAAPPDTLTFMYMATDLAGNEESCVAKTIKLSGLSVVMIAVSDWSFKVEVPADEAAKTTAATTIKGLITSTPTGADFLYAPELPSPLLDGIDETKLNTQLTTKATATDASGNMATQDIVIKVTAAPCVKESLVLGSGIQFMGDITSGTATLQCMDTANMVLASTTAGADTTLQVTCSTTTNAGVWTNMDVAKFFLGFYDISGMKAVGAPPACVATVPAKIETKKTVTFATTSMATDACLMAMKSYFLIALNEKARRYAAGANIQLDPKMIEVTAEADTPVATSTTVVTFMYKYIIKTTASSTYADLASTRVTCENENNSELAALFSVTIPDCAEAVPAPTYTATTSDDACDDGYIVDTTNHRCVPCPPGSFFAAGACTPCAQGTYSNALALVATACTPCATMKSTFAVGATSAEQCVYKCAQYGMKSGQADGLWPCSACTAGMKPDPDSPNMCIACVEGDPSPCPANQCTAGQYSVDSSGTAPCLPCPQNTYQDTAGKFFCPLCPEAMPYTPLTGAMAMASCTDIPADCGTSMCNGHGTCKIAKGLLYCDCTNTDPPQYMGPNCVAIDYCSPNPCYNSGMCTQSSTTPFYTCTNCQNGATGPLCEISKNYCDGVSCGPGKCYNTATSYECKCPETASGMHCESAPNPCQDNVCGVHGTCTGVGTAWYTCACMPGYTGDLCDTQIDACLSSPCEWGGTCIKGVNSYTCNCLDGNNGGTSCSEPATTCATNPCSTSGTCFFDLVALSTTSLAVTTGTMCLCNQYYTASPAATITVQPAAGPVTVQTASANAECMAPMCPTTDPCSNHGTCAVTNNVPTCTCDAFYQGPNCEYDINECLTSSFCGYGTCANTDDGFMCTCDAGYEKDTDMKCTVAECAKAGAAVYCNGHGTCSGATTCQCNPGYTGTKCDMDIDECDSDPCLYGGTCTTPSPNAFSCACLPGFGGSRCETLPMNPCTASSCNSHGTCLQFNDQPYCKCSDGFYGDQCQNAVDLCNASPCLNGGACKVSGTAVTCECTDGFSGDYCDKAQDPCARCGVGTCVPALDATTCSCYGDFMTPNCQTSANDCDTNPCGTSSTCIDGDGEYFCNCANMLKTGVACTKDKDFLYNMYFTSNSGRASSPYPFELGGKDFVIYMRVKYDPSEDSKGTFFTLYGSELRYNIATSTKLLSIDETKASLNFGTLPVDVNFVAPLYGTTSTERVVLIKYTSASNTFQMKVNLNEDGTNTNYMLATGATLPKYGRIVLGSPSGSTGFKGYVSEVFMWNTPTTEVDDVLDVAGTISSLTTGLVTTWFDFQLESGCYNSARTTTSSNPATVPTAPSIVCIVDQIKDLTDRSPGVAAAWTSTVTSTGTLTAIFPSDHLFGWGIYSNAITSCTDNLCSLCTYKIYVKKAPTCGDFTLPTAAADWTCSGTSCVQACTGTNLVQSPAPTYYTCGKGGAFSVSNTNLKLILPSCVASTDVINTLQITVTYASVAECPTRIQAGQESAAVTTSKTSVSTNCATCAAATVTLECITPTQPCGTTSSSTTPTQQTMLISINTVTTDTAAASGAIDAIVEGISGPAPTPTGVKSTIVTSCADGSVLSADGQKCIQCLSGTFRNSAGTCEPCPLNKYQAMAGQTSCMDCPTNKITVASGADAEAKCIDPCPVGKMYIATADPVCQDCPVGYYQNMTGQAFCFPCPAGLTSVAASDAYSDCTNSCPEGKQTDPSNVGQCVPCPVDTYKAAAGPENCTACPAGQTTTTTGQTSSNACTVSTNTYTFTWVINITFPTDTATLQALLTAHLQSKLGSTSVVHYISFVPGSVQVSGTITVTGQNEAQVNAALASYPGTTSNSVATNDLNRECTGGNFLDTSGSTAMCSPCPLNTYQPAGDKNLCRPCLPYYITTATGQTAISACMLSCPMGTHIDGTTCSPCPVNTYQPGTNQTTCTNCPPNTVTDGTGKTQMTDCILAVNECLTANANNCTPTASGGVCTDIPAGFNCSCNANYTGNGVGATGCKHLCDTGYCQNNGTCVRTTATPTCVCTSSYEGRTCSKRKAQSSNEPVIIGAVVGGILGLLLLLGIGLLIAKKCFKPSPKKSTTQAHPRSPQQQPYMYPNYGVMAPASPVFPSNVNRPPMYFPVDGTYAAQAPRDAMSNMGYSHAAAQGTNSPFWIYDDY